MSFVPDKLHQVSGCKDCPLRNSTYETSTCNHPWAPELPEPLPYEDGEVPGACPLHAGPLTVRLRDV